MQALEQPMENRLLFSRAEMAEVVGTSHFPSEIEAQDKFALILKVNDLEKIVAKLKTEGVKIITDVQARPSWGIRTAHLRDPDGNLLELIDEMPSEAWESGLREADEKYKNQQ